MKSTIPLAIIVGGVLIALAVYATVPRADNNANASHVRPVGASDHILGNPSAKVFIIEYSDFECTHCRDFEKTLRGIIAEEGAEGEVAWVFRHLPVTKQHPNAFTAARAAECVAKMAGNDAFWKFVGILFDHQPIDPTTYGALAVEAGVKSADFTACYTNAATLVDDRINADRDNALASGVRGTPYSFILVPGKPPIVLSGAYPYEVMKGKIDEALKGVP